MHVNHSTVFDLTARIFKQIHTIGCKYVNNRQGSKLITSVLFGRDTVTFIFNDTFWCGWEGIEISNLK